MTNARALSARLAELLRREHAAMADFLVALADFDRRRLWLELGYPSLFYFLHRELGLSKGAAHYRKVAAELVQRFPEVVEPLRDGRLCMTSIVELAKVLSPENRGEVLPRFFHCSKREAMAVAAELHPAEAAPYRAVVTAVRAAALGAARISPASANGDPAPLPPEREPPDSRQDAVHPAELADAKSPPCVQARVHKRDSADPLTADLRRLHVTVSRGFLEKLDAARMALSHARPGASVEEILEAGLDLVLARHAKRKGLVEKPRREPRPPNPARPDHVAAHVSREVFKRDLGMCQWKLDSGGVCSSTLRVETDHVVTRARGGKPTVDNLRLLCRVHNDLAARLAFGDAWMDQFTRGGMKPGAVQPPPGPTPPRLPERAAMASGQ